jgi:dihydrofolate reductase
MRKLVAIENVSLDGYADSGEGLGFEWTARAYDEEVDRFANEHVRADVDAVVYGRETYLGMMGYWAGMAGNPDASPAERAHAEWVDGVEKLVCTTTLETADWASSRLVRDARELEEAKACPGGTMAVYASPRLVHGLVDLGLLDELRVLVHPTTLGGGTALFRAGTRLDLELLESKTFGSGAVYVRYGVA